MKEQPVILSTKKLSPSQREQFSNASLLLIEENFITTQAIPFTIETLHQNLIFTSQNAVQSILSSTYLADLKKHKVFCVGVKTKALLEENGFQVEAYTDYASDLAEILTLVYTDESFTFFNGNLRRETLPEAMLETSITFNEVMVYQTTLNPVKINQPLDGILFFSPSGIESFIQKNKINNQLCFCIGETTAETLEKYTQNYAIPDQPTVDEVIETCINYYSR